jgi:transposase
VQSPGEVLAIDWGSAGSLHVFCAVLAWSRFRFVRFAGNERSETTLAMLAECSGELGGVPKVVLADRMGCLKGGVVANKVVPTAEYVRFATHSVSGRTGARPLILSRRGSWRTWSGMPSGT